MALLPEFLSSPSEHFGIRDGIRAFARRVYTHKIRPIKHFVEEKVREHEALALKVSLIPPRVVSPVLETLMAYGLLKNGHVDPILLSYWSLNKAMGWGVPLTCAAVSETESRKFTSKLFRRIGWALWYPQESLPILTYAAVTKAENAIDVVKPYAELVWDHPGEAMDLVMDKGIDMAIDAGDFSVGVIDRSFRRLVEHTVVNYPSFVVPPMVIDEGK